jgi:hypothetical protein
MKDKNAKTYTLVIEYIDSEDRCEYIKESIVQSARDDQTLIIGEVDLYDYFDNDSIDCLTSFDIAES